MKPAKHEQRHPTMVASRWNDGRVLGIDGSMWLYRTVPLGAVEDARSPAKSLEPAEPLLAFFEEAASLAGPIRLTRRSTSRSAYRETHQLLISIPSVFVPDSAGSHELAAYHTHVYGARVVPRRLLLTGIRLNPRIPSGSTLSKAAYIMETLISGGSPAEDYAEDYAEVAAAMARCGLTTPTAEDFALAEGWWNSGGNPWVQYMPHVDHMHVFTNAASAQSAAAVAGNPCESWPVDPAAHTLSFATASQPDLPYVSAASAQARFISALVGAGAQMVSVRSLVEPARVTRDELRRMRKNYTDDIRERVESGKMERYEQESTLASLSEVEAFYSAGGSPTLTRTSIVVAFTGRDSQHGYDPRTIGTECGVKLASMLDVQDAAWMESMIASPVRSNPVLSDLPAQTVACSGLPSLVKVGDETGVILGFGERDGQAARLDATATSDQDRLPIMFVAGATGSGKSMLMVHLAHQFAKEYNAAGERRPVVIADPSPNSDLSDAVAAADGTTASLDDLLGSDGVFDPLRYARTPELGVELATSMLLGINPWGSLLSAVEVDLSYAIGYGVSAGARCTMEALRRAVADGKVAQSVVDPVEKLIAHNPMARAVCGSTPGTAGLRVAEGVTYIRLGNAPLNLPQPGATNIDLAGRIAMAVVRSWAWGAVSALDGRDGVLMLDEGWVFTQNSTADMERIGRLARKMRVLPIIYSQRPTDAVRAGLSGYISRGLILPISDVGEARAACELFGLADTAERIRRITAKATRGDAPNFDSMYALTDPGPPRLTLRGTIAIYADLAGNAAPVEIAIDPELLAKASTRRTDVLERERIKALGGDGTAAVPPVRTAEEPIEVSPDLW